MERWLPRRQNARVSTHLSGQIENDGRNFHVNIVSLSEAGFFCDGFELDEIGGLFDVSFLLEPKGPAWSPAPGAAHWEGDGGELSAGVPIEAKAEVLYLDLSDQEQLMGSRVGLGARFTAIERPQLRSLRDFIARSAFRETGWRTEGGVPSSAPSQVQRSATGKAGAE